MLWDGELDQDIYYYCKWAQTILDQICNHGWICDFSNQGTEDFVGCSLTGAHLIQYHIHAQVWFVWNNKILCPFRPGWFFHWFHHFLRIAAELCPLRAQPTRFVQSSEPSIRIHARTNNVAPPRCSCIVQCTALQDGMSLAQPFYLLCGKSCKTRGAELVCNEREGELYICSWWWKSLFTTSSGLP